MQPPSILVTGDLVLDHHLYEGARPDPQSTSERALVSLTEWGGAELLCRLLRQVELERRTQALWKMRTEAQKALHETMRKKDATLPGFKEPPRPEPTDPDLESIHAMLAVHSPWETRPPTDAEKKDGSLICHSHGYALFSPLPREKGGKDLVWRASKPLGYGMPHHLCNQAGQVRDIVPARLPRQLQPAVICLDDAGASFRNQEPGTWFLPPRLARAADAPWILLKLSGDLESGGLWNELARRKDLQERLVILVAAKQLRMADVRLSTGLSWERSIEHLLFELRHNPGLRPLARTRHLIVHFGIDGAVWIDFKRRAQPEVLAVFDAAHAEGEWASDIDGTAFAYQTCLAAAVARHLALTHGQGEPLPGEPLAACLESGLAAMRRLRMDGHGPAAAGQSPAVQPGGFPTPALARELLNPSCRFSRVRVPASLWSRAADGDPNSTWSILGQAQGARQGQPLYGLARQIILRGDVALNRFPHLRIGRLLTADRADMEALRTLRSLLTTYKAESKPGEKPLSIGIFGAPGSGKSFGVKELAYGIFAPGAKEYKGWREFNLSQFNGPEDLIGAFHQIRDIVLQGLVPVIFWDEFDSAEFKWLQYLLAPMQDGRFQQGESTHAIGRCVFLFAGGTAWTFDSFGEFADPAMAQRFRLAKGPDFKSRLDGTYDVLGPNQNKIPPRGRDGQPRLTARTTAWGPDREDIFFPIRRALIIRGLLAAQRDERLRFDPGLLTAILEAQRYTHGARSMEKIIQPLARQKNFLDQRVRLVRATLPPPRQLRMHVSDPDAFHRLCREHRPAVMMSDKMVLRLACAIHNFWQGNLRGPGKVNPNNKAWKELPEDTQRANLAAARRMPDVLALVGLRMVPGRATQKELARIKDYMALHLDLLAEAEHEGWMEDRVKGGWVYGEKRDDARRQHNCIKPYQDLPELEKRKDQDTVMNYPAFADLIGHKLAFITSAPARTPRRRRPRRRTRTR